MRRIGVYILSLLFAVVLAGCGKEEKFTIEGEVVGGQSMNLYVKYYGDDTMMSGVTAAQQGKFKFVGSSKLPTIVEVTDNEYRVIGRAYVKNGDKVSMTIDRSNPFRTSVKGTPVNVEWSAVCNANADVLVGQDHAAGNAVIERYIAENPESLVGPLLFATAYDASIDQLRADSIVGAFSPDLPMGHILDSYAAVSLLKPGEGAQAVVDTLRYRPKAMDTTYVFTPSKKKNTLLVLSAELTDRSDSLPQRLAKLYKKGDVEILDISLANDTSAWKRVIRNDSAKWQQGWIPGGVYARGIDRLVVPSLPYFILLDTAGRQLSRTTTLSNE